MTIKPSSPYLKQIQQTLPRLLALFDSDASSKSYGMGDRYFWAWGLIDFGNSTFQGAAHGMAQLWQYGLWPYKTSKEYFISRINSIFIAASKLTREDGSLEEAFPNEGSFCVTALVAFDLLCALDLLEADIDASTRTAWQAVVKPMISYLNKNDETHAIISNHLATAVAALVRWHLITRDAATENRALQLLDRIKSKQSSEGWFREYDGADPGYQSLCTYYLADVHRIRPDWNLLDPLRKSIQFLIHFAHPDGSFGGVYGSRCTRFYYPAGVIALAPEIPEAAALADFMANSIAKQTVVTLQSMDEPNLIPMFNSYCCAAVLNKNIKKAYLDDKKLIPALSNHKSRKHFPQAGLIIDCGERHYTIISTHKGGVVYHFVDGKLKCYDGGLLLAHKNKKSFGSTQAFSPNNHVNWLDDEHLIIKCNFTPVTKQLSGPWKFLVLRLFCVSIFRFTPIREFVKKQLVRFLITTANAWPATNRRTFRLGLDLTVDDESVLPKGYQLIKNKTAFVSIHMASQGYWQIQDEREVI